VVGSILSALLVVGLGGYLAGRELWARSHFHSAKVALEQRDFAQAQADLALCLEVWPKSAETQLLAAEAHRRAGDFEQAEQHLARCRQLDGSKDALDLETALLLAQRDGSTPAEAYLIGLLKEKGPKTPLILEVLVQRCLQSGRLPQGLSYAVLLLELQPQHVQALLWRGEILERLYSFPQATRHYALALELDPESDDARLRLAENLLEVGQAKEAVHYFEQLRERQPGSMAVLFGLARCRSLLGDSYEARLMFDGLLNARPHHGPTLAERGRIALQANELDDALKWLRKAVAVMPHDSAANYLLYQALERHGEHKEAKELLDRSKSIEVDEQRLVSLTRKTIQSPNDLSLRAEVGAILLRRGREEDGLAWLSGVLQQDPGRGAAHRALVDYYERTGDLAAAARHRPFASRTESAAPSNTR
jgi:tetratricopeptide (TPR) repeat protein